MDLKRKLDQNFLVPFKRPRNEVSIYGKSKNYGHNNGMRTSSLLSPIMLLSGHEGDIYTCRFATDGLFLASSGFDRLVYLWSVYGECDNFHVMKGHTGAIMQLKFSTDSSRLFTASTDMSIALWDMGSGERIKKLKGHTSFVNSCDVARRGPQILCSGGDDGTIKHWDSRKKEVIRTFENKYQVTAVNFNDTAEQIISAGIDNDIKVWDLRKNEIIFKMKGHSDTVSGMELSPDGSYLLSTSMDNTARIWDVRPFAPADRCVKIFHGHQHTFEKNLLHCAWSPDGLKVASGSGDGYVYVWDTTSRRILYKLPGHSGSVNDVHFHPSESIILSAGSDKKIYLGEIQ